MPTIYLNNGLIIRLYYQEQGHNKPHVHVEYKNEDYVFGFDGEQMEGGRLPRKILKEIQLYLANHQDYLNELWEGDF